MKDFVYVSAITLRFLSNLESLRMNPSRKKNEIGRLKKDFLRLWYNVLQNKSPNLAGKRRLLKDSDENSMEALLAGDLTDDRNRRRNREVPKGFLAVYVGPENRKFVIPASYLSLPDFRVLMERVAEEFGYEQEGGLRIPCEEDDFEKILLRCLAKHRNMKNHKV